MNEWTKEELQIIEDHRKRGYTYYQIQSILEEAGYIRTYNSIKKQASLRFGRKDHQRYSEPPTQVEPEVKQYKETSKSHRVLVIPDLHCPFEHKYFLDFLRETYLQWKCDTVVCLGDEVDAYALSTYSHDPDGWSAGHELDRAIDHLKPFYEAFPNVQVCTSNHTVRGFKRGFEAGIPKAFFRSYAEILKAPSGWSWHELITIDDVNYIHGEGFSGENAHMKAARSAMRSTVMGHVHAHAGVGWIQTEFNRIFGMNCGAGIDNSAYAFTYGKHCANKPVLGAGVVLYGKEAHFITMGGF